METVKTEFSMPCILCGAMVKLNDRETERLQHENSTPVKVCKACRQAIAYIKDRMETDALYTRSN